MTASDAATQCLHGHLASPPSRGHPRNPPPGLFRWHYLQCVIRKFAHSDYKNIQNICHYELPMKMEDDSDGEDEYTDSDNDWPSAPLDKERAKQAELKLGKTTVAEWRASQLGMESEP